MTSVSRLSALGCILCLCSVCAIVRTGIAQQQSPAPHTSTPPAVSPSASPTKAGNGNESKIAAVVDGAVIFQSDVEAEYAALPADFKVVPYTRLYPSLVNRLIDRRLLLNRGNAQGLKNDLEVRQKVMAAEERAIQEVALAREVKRYVTEDALKARYADYVKANPPQEQIRLRLILVESRVIAEEVITALRQGQDFGKLAQERSRAPTAKNGGDIGYVTRSSGMPETLIKAAFLLEAGQFTKTPVESPFGWNILKAEDRRMIKPGTYEEKKQEIANELTGKIVEELLANLRNSSAIERYNIDGSPVPPEHKPAAATPTGQSSTPAPGTTPAKPSTSPGSSLALPSSSGSSSTAPGRPPMQP
ncbi:MAG: peptidylprolyl isomerase [Alphaproteobacteria bacterium]